MCVYVCMRMYVDVDVDRGKAAECMYVCMYEWWQ